MKVTKVYFRESNSGSKMKAFANVELDGELVIDGFRVFEGRNGTFAIVPQDKSGDKWYDKIHWSDKDKYYGEGSETHPILDAIVKEWETYKNKKGSSDNTGNGKPVAAW